MSGFKNQFGAGVAKNTQIFDDDDEDLRILTMEDEHTDPELDIQREEIWRLKMQLSGLKSSFQIQFPTLTMVILITLHCHRQKIVNRIY